MGYIYVYDFNQADFYFSKGLIPVKIGISSRKNVYIKFPKTDELKSAYDEWKADKSINC